MKQLLFISTLIFSLIANGIFGQTIVKHGFENAGDTWAVSALSTPDCNISGDVWSQEATLSSITPNEGSFFWGMQDINGSCGGTGFESITFTTQNVSAFTGVTISFDYYTIGFDAGDDLGYEIWEDGVKVVDDITLNDNSTSWLTITHNVNAATTNVYLVLKARQNGGSDYAGFDNVILAGTSASTDTESEFSSATGTTAENSGTANLPLTISNPAPGATTTTTIELTSGNAAMLTNFAAVGSTVTEVTAAAATSDNYILNIVDNATCDGSETFVFTITNVAGGQGTPAIGTQSTYTLTISDDEQIPGGTIFKQDFDGGTPILSFTGGAAATGNGAFPADPKFVSTSTGRQISNSTSDIVFGTVDMSTYGNVGFSVRLASFSGTSGNGADVGDYAYLSVSTDGGTTYSRELVVFGNSNARWSFTSGTGNATTAYDGDNAATNFTPAGGGNRTADGYSTLSLSGLPSSASLRIKIEFSNNDGNEIWVIDDAILTADYCGCTAPTTQPSNITFGAVTATSIPVSWTNSGDGNSQIVLVSEGSAVNADPTNNVNYTADNDWTGTPDEIGTGNFVIYTGNGGPVTAINLTPNTTYHFAIYEYNTADDCYYLTSPLTGNITTLCDDPSTQPSAVTFASVTPTGMTINWVGGNGTNSIVLIHAGAAVDSDPVDGVSYTADADFSGTPQQIGTGNFVAYTGTLNTVAITGLDPEVTYHVAVYEFNGTSNCYNTTSPATNNQTMPCPSPPDNVAGFAVTAGNTTASITWTNPIFCFDELLIVAEDGTIGFTPSGNGSAYTANTVYGSGTCVNCAGANTEYAVYKGTGTSTTITGLTNGVSYCFKVWTRNGTEWSLQDVVCSVVPFIAYCTPASWSLADSEIEDVILIGENNSITNSTPDVCTNTVQDYSAMSADLEQGGSYTVTVEFGDCDGGTQYNGAGGVWIDWNLDGDFLDAGETIGTMAVAVSGGNVFGNFTINVPGAQPVGNYRMRIVQDEGGTAGSIDPCVSPGFGSIEDYTIEIILTCTPVHSITSFTPTSGPELTMITVTGTGFTSSSTTTIGGVAANTTFVNSTTLLVEIPVGATTNNVVITEAVCNVTSASAFSVTSNSGACGSATSFTDLIISEVYDSDANNVWHIELYNPTATDIDLGAENYTIDRYGDAWLSVSRTITLTGVVPAGSTFLINIGTTASPCGGITFGFTESGGGINANDGIMLVKNGTDVDAVIAPNQTGYSILRDPTASGPTSTYAAGDWTTNTTEACTDLGSFVALAPPPSATSDPTDLFACQLSMSAAGSAGNGGTITYQWLYNDGTAAGWSNVTAGAFPALTVTGETSVSLSITGAAADIAADLDEYQFYCQIIEDGTCISPSKAAQFYARDAGDPQLITAMINSCETCGTEGENEYVILSLGDAAVSVSPANIALNYGTTVGTSVSHTDTYAANVALVNALNAQNAVNGCGSAVFVDAVTTGTLPASSKVIIMDPNICTTVYDFSHFCGSGPIYLLFTTDATWGPGGNFANTIAGDRFFTLSVTDVNGQTVYSEYSYDGSNFANEDGDFAQFSFCEGPATDYRNDGCEIKTATLPAELIQFDATPNGEVVDLDWATATEINVNQHVVQRSQDGEHFSDLLYVDAAGNSSVNTYYSDIDYQPLDGVSYYRLKTVDFDDTYEISPVRIVKFESNDATVLYGNNEWIISYDSKDTYSYTLYNVLGEIISVNNIVAGGNEKNSINHQSLPNGVYFINISSGNYYKSIKVIK